MAVASVMSQQIDLPLIIRIIQIITIERTTITFAYHSDVDIPDDHIFQEIVETGSRAGKSGWAGPDQITGAGRRLPVSTYYLTSIVLD